MDFITEALKRNTDIEREFREHAKAERKAGEAHASTQTARLRTRTEFTETEFSRAAVQAEMEDLLAKVDRERLPSGVVRVTLDVMRNDAFYAAGGRLQRARLAAVIGPEDGLVLETRLPAVAGVAGTRREASFEHFVPRRDAGAFRDVVVRFFQRML